MTYLPDDLNECERLLVAHAQQHAAHFHSGPAEHDPIKVRATEQLSVRAKVIEGLLVGSGLRTSQPLGAHFYGYRITGPLSLRGVTFAHALTFTGCVFDNAVDLQFAQLNYLAFDHCEAPGLNLRGLMLSGSLFLDGSRFNGGVILSNAQIRGDISSPLAAFNAPGKIGLDLGRGSIGGSVFLDSCRIEGSFHATGIRVGGDLDLTRSSISSPGTRAIALNASVVGGNLFLDDGLRCEGRVDLINASIGLTLNLTGCDIHDDALEGSTSAARQIGAPSSLIAADNCDVGSTIFLDGDSTVAGTIRMAGATVGGSMYVGGQIGRYGAPAILISETRLSGDFVLLSDANIQGEVLVTASEFGSKCVVMPGASISVLKGPKLSLVDSSVGGSIETAALGLNGVRLRRLLVGGRARVAIGNLGHWSWDLATGHGHQPWRAVLGMAMMLVVGVVTFRPETMTASVTSPPGFDTWTYAMDVLLPVVNLGQAEAWLPTRPLGIFWYRLCLFAGWFFGVGFAVALGSLFRRP